MREVALSPEGASAIAEWSTGMADDPYHADIVQYDCTLAQRLPQLSFGLQDLVRGFADNIGAASVLRIRGLPIPADLRPTPSIPYFQIRLPIGTEAMLLAISMLVGNAVALQAWRGGDRIHNIYPIPADAHTQKASNSVRLWMHTELAFRPEPAHALAILCLRAGPSAPSTGFCDLLEIWNQLDDVTKSLLSEPAFGFPMQNQDKTSGISEAKPIALPHEGGWRFQYDSGVRGASMSHEKAIHTFRAGMEHHTNEIALAAGDLILIDNLHMAHGRTQFTPSYEGSDRWLQRCIIQSPIVAKDSLLF